jgi:hypothetical protein
MEPTTGKFEGYMEAFTHAQAAVIRQLRMVTNEDTRQALLEVNREMDAERKKYMATLLIKQA